MSTKEQTDTLNAMIHSLEEKKKSQLMALKSQLHLTGESMKPANLLKSAVGEFTGNKHMKSYLIQAGMGLAVGLLTKKLLSKPQKSTNVISNLTELGLKKLPFGKLTPKQISILKIVAPIVFDLVLRFIKSRKRKSQMQE